MEKFMKLARYISIPTESELLKDIVMAAIGITFIGIFAQIHIVLPHTPVPITGQTFAVLLMGSAYGARRSFLTTALYLLVGVIGLPVFAAGASGATILFGASAGYLFGFIPAASLVGFLNEKFGSQSVAKNVVFIALGSVVVFIFGAGFLSFTLGIKKAFMLGVLPFLPGDAIKILLAATTLKLGTHFGLKGL